ncbi:MAG TPA: hypothetical protein VFX59_02825 [Polyangiales bacterium]|nr:hypothetical protein [Polyangiales bacterium]
MRLGGAACVMIGLVACADDAPRNSTSIENVMGMIDASVALDATTPALDARVSAPGLACPAVWDECPSGEPWRVIVDASRFGSGASFTAVAGDLVLVRGGSAPWRVVQVGPDLTPGAPSFVRSVAFPAGAWEARGLARVEARGSSEREQDTDGIAVVACGERCTLLEAALGASALRATGAELPVHYQVRGLQAAGEALCVFGSDVSCFADGRWQRTLDDEVIALALATPRSVALARSGRVFAALLDGPLPRWSEQAKVEGFSAVAASGRRAWFSSDEAWLERTDGQDRACAVPDGVAAVLVALGGSPSLLTGSGDLLSPRANGYCRTQQVQGAVLAASSGPCAGEPRVITSSQLIGDNRCALE